MTLSVSRRRLLGLSVAALAGCLSNPRDRTDPTETPADESTPESGTSTTSNATTAPGCNKLIASRFRVRDTSPAVPPCPDKPAALGACTARRFALGLEKHRRYARALASPAGASEIAFSVTPQTSVREVESGFIVFARLNFRVIRTEEDGDRTPTGESPTATATESDPTGLYNVYYLVTLEGQWRVTTRGVAVGPDRFGTAEALRRAGSPVGCGNY